MPKLKSVIAGLAISTALAGGVVSMGAATTAANATTQVSNGTSVLAGHGCYSERRRCGYGWRRHHHQKVRVRVKVHNRNHNHNGPRTTGTRW
ncbi:hypothetical protein GCM10022419_067330 [Nonomuraea rosea]|uniref:Uncharacterized protein n=1 Tax=Nonomuraea rosea TaxID=638574 RepID=A0ABP6Y4A1_9ACTN